MYCQTIQELIVFSIILIIIAAAVEAAMNIIGVGHVVNPVINGLSGLLWLYLLVAFAIGKSGAYPCNPNDSLMRPFSMTEAVVTTA